MVRTTGFFPGWTGFFPGKKSGKFEGKIRLAHERERNQKPSPPRDGRSGSDRSAKLKDPASGRRRGGVKSIPTRKATPARGKTLGRHVSAAT